MKEASSSDSIVRTMMKIGYVLQSDHSSYMDLRDYHGSVAFQNTILLHS